MTHLQKWIDAMDAAQSMLQGKEITGFTQLELETLLGYLLVIKKDTNVAVDKDGNYNHKEVYHLYREASKTLQSFYRFRSSFL